jgi:hypothetical protein
MTDRGDEPWLDFPPQAGDARVPVIREAWSRLSQRYPRADFSGGIDGLDWALVANELADMLREERERK